MSTSLLYHGFGVYDYTLLKTEYRGGVVVFHIAKKRSKQHCVECGSKYLIIRKGYVIREIRTLPVGSKQVFLSLRLYRLQCKACGILKQEALEVSLPYKKWTLKLARYIVELLQFSTIKDVAKHLHMSWDTIKDIHRDFLFRKFKKRRIKHLRYLGVDEIAIRKGHHSLTIVVDLTSGEIVWVAEDRKSFSLEPFIRRLHYAHVKIKGIAMDMWPDYLNAVLTYFSPEVIVFDRYYRRFQSSYR